MPEQRRNITIILDNQCKWFTHIFGNYIRVFSTASKARPWESKVPSTDPL
jgi:hypothetical protein